MIARLTRSLLLGLALLAAAPSLSAAESRRIAESDGTYTLVHEVMVEAPAAEIWSAISTAQGWATWAVPVAWTDPTDPDLLQTSYDPAAQPGQPQTIQQRFIARIPGRMLAWRTTRAPAGFPDFDTFARVVSIFELEPAGAGRTRVRLTGVGYADSEAGRRLLGFFDQGNAVSLERLQRRFRSGPLDWRTELRRTVEQARPTRSD